MSVELYMTSDKSHTLFSSEFGQHYHSINGAFTESIHIFIELGFKSVDLNKISILEVGYGTGLNAILTYNANLVLNKEIYYQGIDVYCVEKSVYERLEYNKFVDAQNQNLLHFNEDWNCECEISPNFVLHKQIVDLQSFNSDRKFNLIYFDAFSPEVQPEMWTLDVFKKLSAFLLTGGILVTYCSKGIVKQNLRDSGFEVKRFAGPPGKRHVLRATKL